MNYDDMSKEELIEFVKSIGAGGVKGKLMPGANADRETLMRSIVHAGQRTGIIRADLEAASVSGCLHILDCLSKPAAPVSAEPMPDIRYIAKGDMRFIEGQWMICTDPEIGRWQGSGSPVSAEPVMWHPVDGKTHGYEGAVVLRHKNGDYRIAHTNWLGNHLVQPYPPSKPKELAYVGTLDMGYEYWMPLEAPVAAQAQQPVSGADGLPIELRGISEAIGNGGGFWRSCSGCHELNEGHDTGPRSKVFGCALGNGCSECGGIGAIWDTTDYDAMADFMATQAQPDQSMPYETALAELIDKIIPGLDTGDILADARRASAALAEQDDCKAAFHEWLDKTDFIQDMMGKLPRKYIGWHCADVMRDLTEKQDALQAEVLDMVRMLEVNEWADHCGESELGKRLEHAITTLQNRISELTKSSSQQDADSGMLDWLEEQARKSSTGISFDWAGRTAENNGSVSDGGWRFMRRKFLGERKLSIREAIQVAQKALE